MDSYTITLEDVRTALNNSGLSDYDAGRVLDVFAQRRPALEDALRDIAKMLSVYSDLKPDAVKSRRKLTDTISAMALSWPLDDPAVDVEIEYDPDDENASIVNIITPDGTASYRSVHIGEPYGTPTHSYVDLSYLTQQGIEIPLGTAEILEGEDFAEKVAAQVRDRYDDALTLDRDGYRIDSIVLEFAEGPMGGHYTPTPDGTEFETLEDAHMMLLEHDAAIQEAKNNLTPEDIELQTDAYLDTVGYDKHYIDINYELLTQIGCCSCNDRLRFDVGDGPEALDIEARFEEQVQRRRRMLDPGSCTIGEAKSALNATAPHGDAKNTRRRVQ